MKSPSEMSTPELQPYFSEYIRRVKLDSPRARILKPCVSCGQPLSARERRVACKFCGARNPRTESTA